MALYAVWRKRCGAWLEGRPLEAQAGWPEHAAFMTAAQAAGAVLLAGPIDDTGALLIMRAESADAAEARLADDPWTLSGQLVSERVARWDVRIGSLA